MAHDDQCGPEGEHSTTGVTGESDGNRTDQPGDGDSLTDAEEGEKSLLTRRDALKMGATAAAIATGAAVTSGPAAAAGRYGNFPGFSEDPATALFGENYERLVDVKTRYDPENLFRLNQNVAPRTVGE